MSKSYASPGELTSKKKEPTHRVATRAGPNSYATTGSSMEVVAGIPRHQHKI